MKVSHHKDTSHMTYEKQIMCKLAKSNKFIYRAASRTAAKQSAARRDETVKFKLTENRENI